MVERVETVRNPTQEEFLNIWHVKRVPLVLHDLDLGCCVEKWTTEHLAAAVGDGCVKIHVCPSPQMDFINKNFAYKTLPFREFLVRASREKQEEFFFAKDEKYYLRSLGENPRNDVADIRRDFPSLADDIVFPQLYDQNRTFSSVFRIASKGVQLWTHYDIMDNLLMVVSGKKRVVLFPPQDALYLYLKGDKSEVLDIDNPDLTCFPEFPRARRCECTLEAGDVLFIPALWFHNVINEEGGVAVNVFWRNLDNSCYDSKDTYGNKDLVVASRAMQGLDRALKLLDDLPDDYRDFYGRRMIARIQEKTDSHKQSP